MHCMQTGSGSCPAGWLPCGLRWSSLEPIPMAARRGRTPCDLCSALQTCEHFAVLAVFAKKGAVAGMGRRHVQMPVSFTPPLYSAYDLSQVPLAVHNRQPPVDSSGGIRSARPACGAGGQSFA